MGMSHYRDKRLTSVPAAANSLRQMHQLLTDSTLCGWLPEQVTLIDNPAHGPEVAVLLRELAARTDGMFLFYFVGHGTLSEHAELHLPLSRTDMDHVDLTGMPFAHVREALLSSPARVKISILDCCYSGRAVQALSAEAKSLALAAEVRGTYTWAAANGPAHVVPLEQQANACTSFTGELVSLVREGIPNGPTHLTLDHLYGPLRQRMLARNLPLPDRVLTDTASSAPFTWNAWNNTSRTHSAPSGRTSWTLSNGVAGPPSRPAPRRSVDRRNLAALKAAVPLHKIISEYVSLNEFGREFRGACPFCGDDSGQFAVNNEKGVYHCFECLTGGDALTFIRKTEHLSFGEAVDRLAAQGRISLRTEAGYHDRQSVQRIRLVEAHEAAARFYAMELNTNSGAEIGRTFLAERGIDKAAAARFGVGYSRQGWDHLARHLRGQGFTDKELLLSGLIQDGLHGPVDRFRGRLMWPIRNIGGEAVGFGARKLYEADNGPTYITTPETPIYKRSQALFGIDLAKKDIVRTNSAVVVEDYVDAVACHLAGVTTVVSTCGTTFGIDHISILRRLLKSDGSARTILTAENGDLGQQAAIRLLHSDQNFAAESYIAIASSGPANYRLAKGDAAVAELAKPRTHLFEFLLHQIVADYDLTTITGQRAALEGAAPVVARIRNLSLCTEVAIQLADKLGDLDSDAVIRYVKRLASRTHDSQADKQHPPSHLATQATPGHTINLRNAVHLTERELLKIALQRPDLVSPAFDAYAIEEFTAPPYAAVRRAIMKAGGCEYGVQAPQQYLSLVHQSAPDETIRTLVTEMATEAIMCKNVDRAYAGQQLASVRRRSVDRRMQDLLSILSRKSTGEDPSHLSAVQTEWWTLQQYSRALQEKGAEAL